MACGKKPVEGSTGVNPGPSPDQIPGDVVAILGSIGSLVGLAVNIIELKTAVWAILGVSGPALVWLAAVAAALITILVAADFWYQRCIASHQTQAVCSAGVIQTMIPSFASASDEIFPFTAMHDRIDVVVKCDYWSRVTDFAAWVICNTDADTSPILRSYYKNAKVCAAGAGSAVGAVVGGVAGVFLGVLAGAAIASLACGPYVVLCLIAAVLVAAIIAAVCALAGALAGGQIGKAVATDPGAVADDGTMLMVGDYVTTKGGIFTSGGDMGARVYWFVDNTTSHGRSMMSSPFSHTDPDAVLRTDACPM
ncbi:hypothetical protein [Variovorax sp. LjRoot178]|uniref:hypothetical protein n=1 Tax=Variovorax sp. LjRoot178 TaxID=3342277 RepID=UPI003ECD4F5B